MTDKIETLRLRVARLNYETARRHEKAADDARRHAERELQAAKLENETLNPHPWIGRNVKRKVRWGYGNGETRTQRGIVRLHDGRYRRYRGEHPQKGQLFVETSTGTTAYKFEGSSDGAWELDE